MKVCPFRLVGRESLPSRLTAPTETLTEREEKQFACIGPKCTLLRSEPDELDEGWCALGRLAQ